MSRRKIVDYKKVFRELISVLDGQQQVVEFVADFERAMWRAIEDVFSRSKMLGCAFYYTQAVFRRLKRTGLTKLYNANATVHLLLKQFMSLHLITHEKIESQFTRLKAELLQLKLTPVEMAMLDEFFKYFDDTWIVMWSPAKWSVFMQFVRTNNDCEGWHNKINRRAPVTGLNFYFPWNASFFLRGSIRDVSILSKTLSMTCCSMPGSLTMTVKIPRLSC